MILHRISNIVILCILISTFNYAAGQNKKLELVRVELWTPKEGRGNWIVIKQDGKDTPAISGDTKTKVWVRNPSGSISKLPAAYVSGSTLRISACFKEKGTESTCSDLRPDEAGAKYYVRAKVVDIEGMVLPAQKLERSSAAGTYEYLTAAASIAFAAKKIRYFSNFSVTWEWSITGKENSWQTLETSGHTLYITLDAPKQEKSEVGYRHFETLLHIGCKYANGATTNEGLIEAAKAYFSLRSVQRADGQPMKYYGQWTGIDLAARTDDLLQVKDGRCTAWARFFLDILKIQGFQENNNVVNVKARRSIGFFVKTWTARVVNGSSGDPNYPFRNIKGSPFYIGSSYNWQYAEVLPDPPILSGQNSNNPESIFSNHIFVHVMEKLYDPSYGVSYESWESVSVPRLDDPGKMERIRIVTLLDDLGISAYYMTKGQLEFNIHINTPGSSDFIQIKEPTEFDNADDYNY